MLLQLIFEPDKTGFNSVSKVVSYRLNHVT